jgi:hypothetical protein
MERLDQRWVYFILVAFSLGMKSGYAQSAEETLCAKFEEVYFSCPIKDKIVSVCASGNISPENGYVQYRIGRPGHVEFQYPDAPVAPKNRFSISDILGGNLNITHLKFRSGKYDYMVYQGGVNGVYVKRAGKAVANLTCGVGDYQMINPRAKRGIETVPPVDDVDD